MKSILLAPLAIVAVMLFPANANATFIDDLRITCEANGCRSSDGIMNGRVLFRSIVQTYRSGDYQRDLGFFLARRGELGNRLQSHQPAASVPEPGVLGLLGAGLIALAVLTRRRRTKAA